MAKAKGISKLTQAIKSNSDVNVQELWTSYKKAMKPGKDVASGARVKTQTALNEAKEAYKTAKANGATKEVLDDLKKPINKLSDKMDLLEGVSDYEKMYDRMGFYHQMQRGMDAELGLGDKIKASVDVGKDYFWDSATKQERIARIGTATAGVYAGANAVRYATGGTVTYNSKGERDIAGIPFV